MDCAAALFTEKGYYNVTVDEIIACAESSKGSFYTHFKSKEELVINMIELVDEIYAGFVLERLAELSSMDKLASFISFVFETIAHRVGLDFMSVIYSFQIKDPQSPRLEMSPERQFYQVCFTLIEEAKKRSELEAGVSTEHLIRVLATGIRGAVYDWCLYRGQLDLTPYGNEIVSRLLHSFEQPPQPRCY